VKGKKGMSFVNICEGKEGGELGAKGKNKVTFRRGGGKRGGV